MRKEITFDSFIRGTLIAAGIALGIWLINYLSAVLLPFAIAWLVAYMIYPIVLFLERRCRLKSRIVSILVTLAFIGGVLYGIIQLLLPPMVEQALRLKDLVVAYVNSDPTHLSSQIEKQVQIFLNSRDFRKMLDGVDYMAILEQTLDSVANLVSSAASILYGIFGATIILLYLFFILLDYETLSEGWIKFIPHKQRNKAIRISSDVVFHMNRYFRGQALIALCVGILFAVGFTLIQLPMAIALGLFIGILNLVPYLQVVGFVPAIILALLKAADTGQSIWVVLLLVLLVFLVVQSIQDLILTPKIMGKMMGLNPAAILLSLSIWGSLLGFIGLIIALPLTTLIIAYYKDWINKQEEDEVQPTEPSAKALPEK